MSANPKTKTLRWFLFGVAASIILAIIVIVVVFPPCFFSAWYDTKTTVLLVRHAEKVTRTMADDHERPLCNPFGTDRARELAHVAGGAGVNVIYHTEFLRTQQTIGPLDDAVSGNTTQSYRANDVQALARDILDHHRGEVVVVAGHGNTVPQTIEALGGPRLPDIADDDYDNLYVVTVTCACGTRLTQLQYGRTSPLTPDEARQCVGEN
jgi:phosphohistidine phosphatase SixA